MRRRQAPAALLAAVLAAAPLTTCGGDEEAPFVPTQQVPPDESIRIVDEDAGLPAPDVAADRGVADPGLPGEGPAPELPPVGAVDADPGEPVAVPDEWPSVGVDLFEVSATSGPFEIVDLERVDDLVVGCGGFGLDVFTVGPEALTFRDSALLRCQRLAAGPRTDSGERLIFASNHGDAFSRFTGIYLLLLAADGGLRTFREVAAPGEASPEGLAYDAPSRTLYVAAHHTGVLRYRLTEDAELTWLDTTPLTGAAGQPANANKIVLLDGGAAVAAGEDGLVLLDRGVDGALAQRAQLPIAGWSHDVIVEPEGHALHVAAGGGGVVAVDASDRDTPRIIKTYDVDGSALGLDRVGDHLGVTAWNTVHLLDPVTLHPRAIRRLPHRAFTRVLNVVAYDDDLLAAEWHGIRRLRVGAAARAPWLVVLEANKLFARGGQSRSVHLWNTGFAPLSVSEADLTLSDPDLWRIERLPGPIPPGAMGELVVRFAPPEPATRRAVAVLRIDDTAGQQWEVRLIGGDDPGRITVGDVVAERGTPLDRLDLDAAADPHFGNLRGHFVLLAYFATF